LVRDVLARKRAVLAMRSAYTPLRGPETSAVPDFSFFTPSTFIGRILQAT